MSNVKAVTSRSFEQEVLDATKPVVVDFWAEWCGPCRALGRVLDELSVEYADSIEIRKLNVDEHGATAARYGVVSLPTMMVFKSGAPVRTIIGGKSKSALVKDLAGYL